MDAIVLLRTQLDSVHGLSGQVMDGLTPEEVHWRPSGAAHPVGATYAHMVLDEDWFVQSHLLGKAPLYEGAWAGRTGFSASQPSGDWQEWARSVRIDLPALREYARAVYAQTDAYLAALEPEALDAAIEFPPGRGMTRTLGSALSSVLISHHSNHCGEIAAVKGLQNLKGYPF